MPDYGWDVASDSLREAVRSARRAAMFDLSDAASATAVPQPKLRNALADLGRRGRCDSIAADAANDKQPATRAAALSSRWCPPPAVRLTIRSDAPQASTAVSGTAGWTARRFDGRPSRVPRHEILAAVNGSELDLRVAAASSVNCPQATLAALGQDALDEDVRIAAAQNDLCPPAVLAVLVTDADFEVSYAAVRNTACVSSVVAAAALHNDDSWIREATAGHPNCGPQLQRHLAGDPDATVRVALAENSNARVETLEILAGDFGGAVITAVCDNPNTTASVIDTMARNEEPEVRAEAARHRLCSRETLQRLAEDPEDWVRDAAATRQG